MCCVCAFSLRRESPDMILGDEPLISEVVLSHRAMLVCQTQPLILSDGEMGVVSHVHMKT
jgi:hypothetical protein